MIFYSTSGSAHALHFPTILRAARGARLWHWHALRAYVRALIMLVTIAIVLVLEMWNPFSLQKRRCTPCETHCRGACFLFWSFASDSRDRPPSRAGLSRVPCCSFSGLKNRNSMTVPDCPRARARRAPPFVPPDNTNFERLREPACECRHTQHNVLERTRRVWGTQWTFK